MKQKNNEEKYSDHIEECRDNKKCNYLNVKQEDLNINLDNILDIATALSTERNFCKLFDKILIEAMSITNCDGGTLYINYDEHLHFRIMKTVSMNIYLGADGKEIALPPVPLKMQNVCAYAVLTKKPINVNDVYNCENFDFSGPKKYDSITGFKTKSMLVVPMENHYGDVVGVLQLINALDEYGNIISFDKKFERVINSLTSLAAVSITNMNHLIDVKALFASFVSAISSAIDERTPYNASHTRNMVIYGDRFIDYINDKYDRGELQWDINENHKEQILMSIWLHDMGKMTTPLAVMNKETRLGQDFDKIKDKFIKIRLLNRIEFLEGKISNEIYLKRDEEIRLSWETIKKADTEGFLQDDTLSGIKAISGRTYEDEDGNINPWLSDKEMEMLKVRKGTLTRDERLIMENHVVITEQLLKQINFTGDYNHVVEWASAHHEYLDGTGYPNHLTAESLSREVRLITILDIYDALTARDRPYKKPLPVEKALCVLEDMVKEGKLDGELVELFKESHAWVRAK